MKTAKEYLKEKCPNHTEKSKFNKSELLSIVEDYHAEKAIDESLSVSPENPELQILTELGFE